MRLELVKTEPISNDTAEALAQLAEEARSGEYTGFVIGLLRPRRRYSLHCIGEACEVPTWSRGIVAEIDDELHAMIQADDRDTTF